MSLHDEKIINVIDRGKYYNPATSHYASEDDTEKQVFCNRCKMGNLQECYGYEDYDLCMSCVDKVSLELQIEEHKLYQNLLSDTKLQKTILAHFGDNFTFDMSDEELGDFFVNDPGCSLMMQEAFFPTKEK